jgi:anaerobic magnesium-protoporphyrin IX monomethyl ester cyclase
MNEPRVPQGKSVLLLFPSMREASYGSRWKLVESPAAPLGLLYLAPPLIRAGYRVAFVDLSVDRLQKGDYFRVLRDSDFILISCFSQALHNIQRVIADIRLVHKDAWVICGGPHGNETGYHVNGADVTVYGEAEQVIAELLEGISSGGAWTDTPGISYSQNGRLVRNPGFHTIEDLDSIEPPSFDLARNKNYGYLYGVKVKNIAGVMTSRGCPFECTFCTFRRVRYRERSVSRVVDEIQKRKKEGADYLVIYDDNFLMRRSRAIEIMNAVIQNRISLKMAVQGRVDFVDRKLLKVLKDAGVIILLFGLESANQDVLDFYNKKTTVAQAEKAISLAHQSGMITFGNLIIGAPMETSHHFETDGEFLKRIPLDLVSIHILNYICGSTLWNDACRKGLIEKEELHVLADRRLSQFTTEELAGIRAGLIKSFYNDRARILRLAYKLITILGVTFLFKLIKMFVCGTIYRSSTKFHGSEAKNITISPP